MSNKLVAPVPKTTEGLRDALFDEINLIRSGLSNPQRARSVAMMASRIVDSIRVQIQYGRLLTEKEKAGKEHIFLGTK